MSDKAKVRIGRLNTVGGVVTELGKVYRLARRGQMDMGEAKGLTYILRDIRCALEAKDVERRLDELEALYPSQRPSWERGNGAERHDTR